MCHARHLTAPDTASASRGAPADPDDRLAEPRLRASDAEREQVAERLRRHAAEGRLAVEELEERLTAAWSARTRGELEPLLADLPAVRTRRAAGRSGAGAYRHALARVAPLAVLLIAIWAATGAGPFWPVWPILGVLWFGRPRRARVARSAIP